MTETLNLPSWPGLFRPSAHERLGVDGRDKPGHDDGRVMPNAEKA
ncbi:hypothetical protein [Acidisphaera sp. S103]|nr:hypothetical protein [Acidisphaera sp. S103]